ncbi:jacalin-like lectin [Streptomyces sp. SHP 1-2]|uniref:jacalin-like lectin n=1 Tax=Streptomyces sp. SHP 1-2 TaxID=2769489 RepID=UPI0039DF31CC
MRARPDARLGPVPRPAPGRDSVVDQIGFETNLSVYGPFGGSGGDPFEFKLPIGAFVAGFHGSAAKLLDALGVLYYQDAPQ